MSWGNNIYSPDLLDCEEVCSVPWNRCRWSCCTPRSRWRRRSRSTWCSRGAHPSARTGCRSATRHTASSRSDRSASPCSSPSCTPRWKSAARQTILLVDRLFTSGSWMNNKRTTFSNIHDFEDFDFKIEGTRHSTINITVSSERQSIPPFSSDFKNQYTVPLFIFHC